MVASSRYPYPSGSPAHVIAVGAAEFFAAISFFLYHLVPQQEICHDREQEENPGSGGDADPHID